MLPINESFTDYASGIRLLNCPKLAINQKKDNDITICWHVIIVKFCDVVKFFFSCQVSYCSKFPSSRVTGYNVSELSGKNQLRVKLPLTQIMVNYWLIPLINQMNDMDNIGKRKINFFMTVVSIIYKPFHWFVK